MASACLRRARSLPQKSSDARSPLVHPRSVTHSGEGLCGGSNDLIVWHVAYALSDVPAMPERVLELAVPVAPEHVRQRLTNRCARRYRLREHGLGVSDLEGQHHGRAANRGRASTPISGTGVELFPEGVKPVHAAQIGEEKPATRSQHPAHLGEKKVSMDS
jgi:hypothetical protein